MKNNAWMKMGKQGSDIQRQDSNSRQIIHKVKKKKKVINIHKDEK